MRAMIYPTDGFERLPGFEGKWSTFTLNEDWTCTGSPVSWVAPETVTVAGYDQLIISSRGSILSHCELAPTVIHAGRQVNITAYIDLDEVTPKMPV